MSSAETFDAAEGVAVVGMAGRFPGARNLEEFWQNLRDGVESISFFTDEELAAEGVEPELVGSERYVRARGVLADIEWFDAAFFGLSPREAEITDPQHRLFLECAWEALEEAGYDARQEGGRVGVFGGCATNTYLVNIYSHPELLAVLEPLQISVGNDKDYLTTRVSYKLNLTGPSLTVQSACSTSLAAVHLACRSLLGYQCDVALAGGAKIVIPQRTGYLYQEGGMNSPDGHCRAFDADARGTVGGNGVGVVVLKRLEDALADGDQIHAVIRGSAVNNDGSLKVGYTAPSVEGQAEAVAEALAVAGVEAESIGYVEAHGTGTPLGDPIEIAALTKAFRAGTERNNFCAVGSVKTNIGHLDAASGMAALFKTVLALKHKTIPPSLHFAEANPQIDFPNSPFFVNTRPAAWPGANTPRRAGVNAYSIGGTNAHVILEEAPPRERSEESRRARQLLVVSARTRAALDAATRNLRAHLDARPELDLADVAYTLQVGRRAFEERRVVVCRDRDDALRALEAPGGAQVFTATLTGHKPPVAFLFPGEFEPHLGACGELYAREPAFRREFERCSELLRASLSCDLRELLPAGLGVTARGAEAATRRAEARRRLHEPRVAFAAAFVFEHALARLWAEWGVVPAAAFGEGAGEYAAACARGEADAEEILRRLARGADLPPPRRDPTAVEEFIRRPGCILLELGAGRMTREVVARRRGEEAGPLTLSCLGVEDCEARGADSGGGDSAALLSALGRMWLAGAPVDWKRFHAAERRQRVSLPTYPFERQFFWVELPHAPATETSRAPEEGREATPEPTARASYARASLKAEYAAPRSESERALVRIWQEVIGVSPVGVNDDFFELGGDSVMSLQIIARAHQAGLRLTPREVFERPTIAELAASADVSAATPPAAAEESRATVTGPVPLTPIQSWFFEEEFTDPHHFNQAVLLGVRETLDPALVERSVRALLIHHDALRLRFARGATGWRQFNAGADRDDGAPFVQLDFSELPPDSHEGMIEDASRRLQASLNLSSGPLLRVALYHLGAGRAARLLLCVHHLAVDAVSWRILLEDLQTAYGQLSRGEPVRLPAKSTSFKRWAERLTEHAWSEELQREAEYWCAPRWEQPTPVPLDFPAGVNSEASARTLSASLDEEETGLLLKRVPAVFRTQINDALLTGLALAFARWTGGPRLLVETEGHGREDIFAGTDVSRTVGWFTTLFPLLLDPGPPADAGRALAQVKEQLRAVPCRGIGYGLLKYLGGGATAVADRLRRLPRPEVFFLYLGQLDRVIPGDSPFAPAAESPGPAHVLQERRRHVLELKAFVAGGRLQLLWSYSENLHRRETIETLAGHFTDSLRALVEDARAARDAGPTPADFPLARIDQPTLDRILNDGREVEDLYALTPLQEGLLFHTLYEPQGGAYVIQLHASIRGDLDVGAFERAWAAVVARHTVLRTAFVWEELDEPLQVVERGVRLPLERHDWRGLDEAERDRRLDELLRAERHGAFKVSRAPLMRLALVRTGDLAYQFVWSQHHLLLDGWSMPLLLNEVATLYAAFSRGQTAQLEPSRPFRDYVEWLRRQDLSAAEQFWRDYLKGFSAPTPLPARRGADDGGRVSEAEAYGELNVRLAPDATSALRDMARRNGLTLNTVFEGAWALLLAHHSGADDVVFGVTVSGRPSELVGMERMVGMFVNTLPLRVKVERGSPLVAWLKGVQRAQAEVGRFDYSPLVEVQGWGGVPRTARLFETLITFQNVPALDPAADEDAPREGELHISSETSTKTHYPLTLLVEPAAELSLRLLYDRRIFEPEGAARVWRHLETLLTLMGARPAATLEALEAALPESDRRARLLGERERERAHLSKLRTVKPRAVSLPDAE